MRDTSLLAHELLCLHLKSFYGVECSSTARTLPKKATKKSRLTGFLHLRKYR
jgi:hypothetical protein